MSTVEKEEDEIDPEEQARLERLERMPALDQCYNLMDFEAVARRVMKRTAWGYYSSGADDEIVRSIPYHYCRILTNLSIDNERKPLRLPQNLVPPQSTRRR